MTGIALFVQNKLTSSRFCGSNSAGTTLVLNVRRSTEYPDNQVYALTQQALHSSSAEESCHHEWISGTINSTATIAVPYSHVFRIKYRTILCNPTVDTGNK